MDNATPKLADHLLVDLPALQDDARIITEGMARVRTYRSFLARARAAKATGSADIDAQVLASARRVRQQSQDTLEAGARIVRALHLGGAVTHVADIVARSVESGPVTATDLWAMLDGRACEACAGIDVDRDLLAEFRQVFGDADLALVDGPDGPRLQGSFAGRSVDAPVQASPRDNKLPTNAAALLASGRLLALCDAIEEGEPAYLLGVGYATGHPTLEEAMMRDLLTGQREMIRHVRKLEDIGLSTRAGGDPATLALVAIGVMIAGVIMMTAYCGPEEGALGDAANSDNSSCATGAILTILGIVGLFSAGPPPDPMSTTGQNISGPLPQLQG